MFKGTCEICQAPRPIQRVFSTRREFNGPLAICEACRAASPARTFNEARTPSDVAFDMAQAGAGEQYAARPYLLALRGLVHPSENYGEETGKSVALYALSNLTHWRTRPAFIAANLKAELRAVYGIKAR